ncbi:MAG: MBL fold metallo-hydrolase [Gammaproteobacteria bacterium]
MTSKAEYIDYQAGISCIETGYMRPGLASCYLIVQEGRAALVDTGTWHTVARIMAVLEAKGIAPENVDYVMPTHVHLDHAGGAGELMRRFPNAKLVVHPRGARHMVDPAKLKAGTISVYGEGAFKRDYVDLVPVSADRVIEAEDGQVIMLGDRALEIIDTPGHASHHFCVWDETSGGMFTGDTFGLSYRELDVQGRPMVLATTTPVQFNPEAWQASLDKMMARQPSYMFLTHYGRVGDVPRLCADLRAMIDRLADITLSAKNAAQPMDVIRSGVRDCLFESVRQHGVVMSDAELDDLLGMDIDLDAQGLLVWLERRATSRG